MKSLRGVAFLALLVSAASAQPRPEADDPIIQLPPLIVEESRKTAARPWHYAEGPGFEVLSRCSESTTADFARGFHRANHLLQILVPAEFQVNLSCPHALLLYRTDMVRQLPAEIVAEMTRLNPARISGPFSVKVLPNMALRDSDFDATYSVVDEYAFYSDAIRIAPEALRWRLESRTPALPRWFIEGVMRLYGTAHFQSGSVNLTPHFWINSAETKALRANREHPRSLLPLEELFKTRYQTPDLIPDPAAQLWRDQAALFIRWAFDGKKRARRDALFKFVHKASEAPATEAMFEECFGFDYADAKDRLSDYLSQAVNHPLSISSVTALPRLNLHVRGATPGELARVKGDWERLSTNYVRVRFPSLTSKYQDQARLTLLRAYDQGERDPDLLAAIALSYCDAGEAKAARPFLEQATSGKTRRTRAHVELAWLRYHEYFPGEGAQFSDAQIEEILQPLRSARKLPPPLPESYELAARVLSRGDRTPTMDELTWILEGVIFFPRNSMLIYQAAHLHVLHGAKSVANLLIRHGLAISHDDATRSQFEKLGAALALRSN